MPASDRAPAHSGFVICRNITGAAWFYWTGNAIGRRRQKWRTYLRLACRFHRAENAADTIARLAAHEAIVCPADAIVGDD